MRNQPEARPFVVIVEDDPSVRRALSRCLRAAGLDVQSFATGGELLDHPWPVPPACLVIDVHLPDIDGLALLQCFAEKNSSVPAVVITGDRDPELRARALRQGAAAFLTKPCEETELVAAVRGALGR